MKSPYDPKLPVLAELERQVREAAEQAIGQRAPSTRVPRQRDPHRQRRRRRSRVLRRALTLVALALMVGATALAATGAFDTGSDPAVSGATLVAASGEAGGGYRLVLHSRGEALCRALITALAAAGRCQAPPRGRQVQPLSAIGTDRRFVFGLAGPRVGTVRIRVGRLTQRVPARRLEPRRARAVGIDPSARVFVATVPPAAGSASEPPAFVNGRVDCSLTIGSVKACTIP